MLIVNRSQVTSRQFSAGRISTNVAGGRSPIQPEGFSLGHVVLEPNGGQVPWHNHDQEEIYYILSGAGEMCVGSEVCTICQGDAVYIPSGVFHQLTNTGSVPLEFVYCYSPTGDVAHWRQELDGTLPRAGVDAPDLPEGAAAQRI